MLLPHTDVDDLEGSAGLLEEGEVYNLPVLPLDGTVLELLAGAALPQAPPAARWVDIPARLTYLPAGLVLCPGNTLPLKLTFRGDRALVQQALDAPAPLTRLIAVVCCQRSYFTPQLMLQR